MKLIRFVKPLFRKGAQNPMLVITSYLCLIAWKMNFYDVALAKVSQFDGERFSYNRKKTEREGDYFSICRMTKILKSLTMKLSEKVKINTFFH